MISLGCTIIVFLFLLHDDNASIVLSSSNPDFAEKTSSSLTVHQSMQSRPKESTSARLAATPLAPAATPTAPVLRTVETPLSPPRAMPRVSPAVGFSWGFPVVLSIESMPSWYFLPGSNPSHASSYTSTGASHGDAHGWRDPMGTGNTDVVGGLKYESKKLLKGI